jgi:hypothetical protein
MKRIRTIKKIGSLKREPSVKNRAIAARVTSIEAHDYSPETGHLTVTFSGGRRYRYKGVDQKTAESFRDADSQGRFLHSHVIGKFDATKI